MIELRRAQAEQRNPISSAGNPSKPYFRIFFWCLAIALGLLQVWSHRNEVNPDGISYIEMAEATGHSGWHALVNGYWSPLYPFLLSIGFRVFHPAPQWEFTAVHFVNFALYLANLFCFEIFLRELFSARVNWSESRREFRSLPEKILWVWGYLFFFWACQFWLSPAMPNPDMCVAGLIYLATALLLRLHQGKGNWLLFVVLGAVLGLAYLAKTAMFLVSLVFLLSSFFLFASVRGSYRKALVRSLAAFVVFAAVAAPLVIALSNVKHRVTFGDAGKINYAMYVNRAPLWVHWHGQPPGTGVPAHPMRELASDPLLYEFAQPVPGSYPPWYDPSYWYEGIKPHFSLRGQAWALYRAGNVYLKLISRTGALYIVFLTLVLLARKTGNWEFEAKGLFWVWLPSFAALGMYALVHVEQRFLSGFALMLLMWILSSWRLSEKAGAQLRRRVILLAGLSPALAIAWAIARDVVDVIQNKPYEPWVVAQQLHAIGIPPGTEVGYIGTGLGAYWAHLAGVRIIAEIPDKEQPRFIAADAARRQQILALISSLGARAVVTRNADAANPAEGWRQIPGTHHFIWKEP